MMSNFNYCPICGQKRVDDDKFCQNCDFEFITGKYVKLEDDSVINIKKVSQEEFVDANRIIRLNRDKLNYLISRHLTNLFDEDYLESLEGKIVNYISNNLNKEFDESFDGDYLKSIEALLDSEDYINPRNKFIQWIDENRTHLPIFILSNYKISVDENINNLNSILNLDIIMDSKEDEKFIKILNRYLLSEKEFQEKLI